MQEQVERREERSPIGSQQVLDAEREVRGRLASRRVHEPQLEAGEEDADGDPDVAQEPLELRGGRVAPGTGGRLGVVEVDRRAGLGEVPDEREPRFPPGRVHRGGDRHGVERRERVVGREGAAPERERWAISWPPSAA